MTKEEWLKYEYSKIIANPEKVYLQNPSIIKAAHYAMQQYADQECAASKTRIKELEDANALTESPADQGQEELWEEAKKEFSEYKNISIQSVFNILRQKFILIKK